MGIDPLVIPIGDFPLPALPAFCDFIFPASSGELKERAEFQPDASV
jgi:hypothetical protein